MNLAKWLYARGQDLLVMAWECRDPEAAESG